MTCQKCGYCCQTLILEADYQDALLEPRIASEGTMLNADLPLEERSWSLNGREDFPCIFLNQETNLCTIYATRPQMCQGFDAGYDERCAQCDGRARERQVNTLVTLFGDDGDPIFPIRGHGLTVEEVK